MSKFKAVQCILLEPMFQTPSAEMYDPHLLSPRIPTGQRLLRRIVTTAYLEKSETIRKKSLGHEL